MRGTHARNSAILPLQGGYFRLGMDFDSLAIRTPGIPPYHRIVADNSARRMIEPRHNRLMGAIGPATIILVSVVIGALIVSIMSALLSITELAL